MIYEDDRIKVTEVNNKVRIEDKFSGQFMTMNRAAFDKMCREVAKKEVADVWE